MTDQPTIAGEAAEPWLQAASWFREYEAGHRAKLGPIAMDAGAHSAEFFDAKAKVYRNRERAEFCEAMASTPSTCEARLEEALSFYADEARWQMNSSGVTSALDDRGFRARQALGGRNDG